MKYAENDIKAPYKYIYFHNILEITKINLPLSSPLLLKYLLFIEYIGPM